MFMDLSSGRVSALVVATFACLACGSSELLIVASPAFGETVNWDLVPEGAIRSITLQGSDPTFGLNALAWPGLRPLLTNNFVRGAVTGLGFVNLCAGFADLALVFAARERRDAP